MHKVVFVAAFFTVFPAFSAQPVRDESTRLRVLRQAFPKAHIVRSADKRESSVYKNEWLKELPLQDALKNEQQYHVSGPVSREEEDAASDVTFDKPPSETRSLRLRLFRWQAPNNGPQSLVAVLAYTFMHANPPNCCQAIGKVLLLSNSGDRILGRFVEMPHAFTMFTSIDFLAVNDGEGEKLLIEEDYSQPGEVGVALSVLDLSHQRIEPQLWVAAASSWPDKYVLILDDRATILAKGKQYHFVKTTYAVEGKVLATPVVAPVSYSVGSGL